MLACQHAAACFEAYHHDWQHGAHTAKAVAKQELCRACPLYVASLDFDDKALVHMFLESIGCASERLEVSSTW